MFRWQQGATIDLEAITYATVTNPVSLVGATRDTLFTYDLTHPGDGTRNSKIFRVTDIPSFLSVQTDNTNVDRGEFYAAIYLRVNGTRAFKLCSGYISVQNGISYPFVETQAEHLRGGLHTSVAAADPAAGADFVIAVPTNELWILKGGSVDFTTDANAANRSMHIRVEIHGIGGPAIELLPNAVQAASLSRRYTIGAFGNSTLAADDNDIQINMPPDMVLKEGDDIRSIIFNKQATDDITQAVFYIEKFLVD